MPVSFMFEIVDLSWAPAAQTGAAGICVVYCERKAAGAQVCWVHSPASGGMAACQRQQGPTRMVTGQTHTLWLMH